MAERIKEETGLGNLVVVNAGIMGSPPLKPAAGELTPSLEEYRAHALKTPMEEFTHTYAANTTGVYYTALAFLSLLDAANTAQNLGSDYRSQVLAVSSIGGFIRLKGASFAYSTSKAATTHLMKMMATSLVPYRIRCTVLVPRVCPSELVRSFINNLKGPGNGGVSSEFNSA
jgi:NAD(P)-dependent dehydrogenase (short-subunit alcohol dehydrogenase family)